MVIIDRNLRQKCGVLWKYMEY